MGDGVDRAISLLRRCGAPEGSIQTLDVGPDLIRYWDLTAPEVARAPLADLVVEGGGSPALFVRCSDADGGSIARLRRVLALRGDGSRLAVYEPGRLALYDVALDTAEPSPFLTIQEDHPDETLIPTLLSKGIGANAGASRRFMFDLLREVTDAITTTKVAGRTLTANDALSLAGRALFLRFLFDRGIVTDTHVCHIARGARRVEELFANADTSYATSAWLDQTFNGNLLPLPEGAPLHWFRSLPADIFHHLTNILHRAPRGQLSLPLGWAGIDFAHVPPGLLSEVYEAHCARHYEHASDESVYYTPRNVAEFMVSQSLDGLERPWEARVLDPSAGAGVFLVAAFRALVAARWRHDNARPSRATLRAILNEQLVGLDINETALRLAALSLYLTALELDPDPTPPEELRFGDLRDKVLFDVRAPRRTQGSLDPGSLGAAVGDEHEGRYDLVLGNPPWTAWSSLPAGVQQGCDRVWHDRGGVGPLTLADKAPDLAFLWRAMGWARPGARIALALHGRLLFRQSAPGIAARNEVLRALHVTGIVNGAALRQTEFWPDVEAPFCLLFAQNVVPTESAACWFVSPEQDPDLNDRGRNRIDMEHARPVLLRDARDTPWALKSRFRGLDPDRELLSRLMRFPSLGVWWNHTLGLHAKHQGYQVGGAAGTQKDASAFHGLPDLRPKHLQGDEGGFSLDGVRLPLFKRPTLLRSRERTLYRSPLVVVPESIRSERTRGRAALSTRDIFFCESYHGWSCADAQHPALLARYLFLLFNSDLVRYISLLTSGKYGVERDVVYLEDLERLPVRPLDALDTTEADSIVPLADALVRGPSRPWAKLDDWIASVYGLSTLDQETMRDTLAVSTPEGQGRALASPTTDECSAWCALVAEIVSASLRSFGREFTVSGDPLQAGCWLLVRFNVSPPLIKRPEPRCDDGILARVEPPLSIGEVLQSADNLSVTEVVVREPNGSIAVARVAQYRYWTPTRARVFAARLLQDHGDVLAGVQ